jgi:protoheme IX farnesyltransferase
LTHTAELALPTTAVAGVRARLGAFVELAKPGIVRMVLITGGAGFFMGSNGFLRYVPLLWTLFGMALAGAGACALNEVVERERDTLMRRTANRPLPAGRLGTTESMLYALALSVAGVVVLAWRVNLLSALLVGVTIVAYVGVYTPLKRRHWTATLVGAVPGALPILAGWAAAAGRLEKGGLALFAILFAWQMPHFFALAWMYRDDYRRGGFRMISERDATGHRTARQIVVWGLALVAVSTLPTITGISGPVYAATALLLGASFLLLALALLRAPSDALALRVFLASVTYLPVLLLVMVLERLLA